MSDPYEPTSDTSNEHTDQDVISLQGYEAYVADSLEHLRALDEGILETNLRMYDALCALITAVSGSRETVDGMREAHAHGQYLSPGFYLAGDDNEEERPDSGDSRGQTTTG